MTDDQMCKAGAVRLLQVAIDMLTNPLAVSDAPKDERYPPSKYRCEIQNVEAAYRACIEAQALLRMRQVEVELEL